MTLGQTLLSGIPKGLRDELLASFEEISRNYRETKWEPSELNGGKLCEVAYSIIKGFADNNFPSKAFKPKNMVDACRDLEKHPNGTLSRSFRILIPRMIIGLYEVRNNRGVGHVGGDVNPNQMDAILVFIMSKWILSEFVRVFHGATTEEASAAVESLMSREVPWIWKVGKSQRVLKQGLTMKNQVLLMLYAQPQVVKESQLFQWIEHSNRSVFRRDVLRALHKGRQIEYDPKDESVVISPVGIDLVEKSLLN